MVYNVYISPEGDDSNTGTSESPLKTLTAANRLLGVVRPQENIAVILKNGTHNITSSVRWTYYNKKYFTTLIGESATGAILNGNRIPKALVITNPNGENTAIRIKNFTITNCANAITIEGDANNPKRWIGAVAVSGMYFTNIGGKYADSVGYGAVRVLNASRCSITSCTFKNIENSLSPHLLHAVYLAHGTRNCLVRDCVINKCTGDVFRARDSSNYNVFDNNTIINSRSNSLFGEWYNTSKEKPSYGNVLRNNAYSNGSLFVIYQGGSTYLSVPRLRTAGNERS